MSTSYAWLLSLGAGLYAATGERELRYLLADKPRLFTIPQTVTYCNQIFIWQGTIVPVMDMGQRVLGHQITRNASEELIVLANFKSNTSANLQYGALLLDAIPIKIEVSDSQACSLPEPQSLWQYLAISCVQHEQYGVVPILNLAQVFTNGAV